MYIQKKHTLDERILDLLSIVDTNTLLLEGKRIVKD